MAVVFRRLAAIKVDGKVPLYSVEMLGKFAVIAVPSMLQQSFISVGNIIIQSVINGFGTGVMAGYSAAIKLNNLVITSFTTLGNGISNFTAQNMGAGLSGRVKDGFKAGWKMVWIISMPLVALYLLAGKALVGFFISSPSEEAMNSGVQFLRIVSPFYFVVSLKLVSDGILRGAGMMKQFVVGTFSDLILRVILAIVFAAQWGPVGIWSAWPVGWSIAMVISVIFYSNGPWKNAHSAQK
jgi:Na+-driven multidrug efflux pump